MVQPVYYRTYCDRRISCSFCDIFLKRGDPAMVSLSADVEMKAGHPPAVKAGGMRVARHRQLSSGETKEKNDMTKEEIEEYGVSPPKESKEIFVSGARISEEKAFPPEALRQYHVKPLPCREMRPVKPKHVINQPK